MNSDNIEYIEYNITFSFSTDTDDMLELGKEINRKYPYAYMNEYNWTKLFHHYVEFADPSLSDLNASPRHGDYVLEMPYEKENLRTLKKLEQHLIEMFSDKKKLLKFIGVNYETIQWNTENNIVVEFAQGDITLCLSINSKRGFCVCLTCKEFVMFVDFRTLNDLFEAYRDRSNDKYKEVDIPTTDGGKYFTTYALQSDDSIGKMFGYSRPYNNDSEDEFHCYQSLDKQQEADFDFVTSTFADYLLNNFEFLPANDDNRSAN